MAMRVVISDTDSIAGWLYPGAFGIPDPPNAFVVTPELDDADFCALWRAASPDYDGREATAWENSDCDVGLPHDAPGHVYRVVPDLLEVLASIPDHERWRVAQNWAANRLEKRPNDVELKLHKQMMRDLCNLARQAIAADLMVLLIPDSWVCR